MAACRTCGTKVGMLATECGDCVHRRRAFEQAAAQAALLAEVQQREARQAAYVADAMSRLTETLESGRPVSLYESVYLPVDSVVNDEQLAEGFDLLQVQTLGWEGWEVVSVVPRTVGVGLMNVGGGSQAWGAGLGGNVAGVHVVLRLVVQPEAYAAAGLVLEGHVARTFRG